MAKGDKFSLNQCPMNNFKEKLIQKISYAKVVRSLMYVQFCTRLAIAYNFWDVGQVFKKFKIRPLESSQMGHTVFKENKILHVHILEVRSA
jgi:hypothetical protein